MGTTILFTEEKNDMNNIFFISFPSSGSHWLLNVIRELTGESWCRFIREKTDYTNSLFIKTHDFIRYSGKTIYIYRDAKDTIFSWSKQLYKMAQKGADCDLGRFNAKWIRDKLTKVGCYHPGSLKNRKDSRLESKNPKVVYYFAEGLENQIADRWVAHMDFYHNSPKQCEVYYVKYETLVRQFKSTIKGILEFCGLKSSNDNFEVPYPLQPQVDKIGQYKKSRFWTKSIDQLIEKIISNNQRQKKNKGIEKGS